MSRDADQRDDPLVWLTTTPLDASASTRAPSPRIARSELRPPSAAWRSRRSRRRHPSRSPPGSRRRGRRGGRFGDGVVDRDLSQPRPDAVDRRARAAPGSSQASASRSSPASSSGSASPSCASSTSARAMNMLGVPAVLPSATYSFAVAQVGFLDELARPSSASGAPGDVERVAGTGCSRSRSCRLGRRDADRARLPSRRRQPPRATARRTRALR